MVKGRTLLQLAWHEHRLTVVGSLRELWPPQAALTTSLRREPLRPEVEVRVLGVPLPLHSSALDRPLLHEDAVVDVYLEGPGPGTLEVRPRASSAELVHQTSTLQHYRVAYRGAVGDVEWTWTTRHGVQLLGLEVFPSKLDYRRDYQAIYADLLRVAPQLVLSLVGQAGRAAEGTPRSVQETELEWLEHVRRESDLLQAGMAQLLPRLRSEVRVQTEVVQSDRVRRARPAARRDYRLLRPGAAPRSMLVEATAATQETTLNGHLRWELEQLASACAAVLAQPWIEKVDAQVLGAVRGLHHAGSRWQAALAHVPAVHRAPDLHTRLRDPRYAVVLGAVRRLRQGLTPSEASDLVGLKDLPTLYEYWVYLSLLQRLQVRFPHVVQHGGSLVRRVGGELVLARGVAARTVLRDDVGRTVTATYNRRFANLPTTAQQPDSVIEVEDESGLLIIDAKYRLGRDRDYLARHGCEGPLEDDINVLHRYRDAIVQARAPHRRLVAAGLIAFPGADTRRYRSHQFCRSWTAVWIGGVPMLPGQTGLLDECLEQFFAMRTVATSSGARA